MRVQAVRQQVRKIPSACKLSCDGEGIIVPKFLIPHCQEKPLARKWVAAAETDTGSRGENPKVSERTLVTELGKTASSLREKGCSSRPSPPRRAAPVRP